MGHALVLNATYEPLCVVPARRALLLVLMRKAISVEDSDLVLHSSSIQLRAPAVVRLRRLDRSAAPSPVGRCSGRGDEADAAEIVVSCGPAPHGESA